MRLFKAFGEIGLTRYSTIPKLLVALPDDYNAYGHFLMDHLGNLVCDGYFKYPWEVKKVRENSTDNGPDPHKKDAEYICKVLPDWEAGVLTWIPLCKHESAVPGMVGSHVPEKSDRM